MGLFGGLTKTISGVAKTALGSVSQVRSVLNVNPSLAGLVFPPQIQMGLKVAGIAGGALGIKVPTQDDILGFAQGKLDKVLGGIRAKVKSPLEDIEGILKSTQNLDFATRVFSKTIDLKGLSPDEVLNSISWLL